MELFAFGVAALIAWAIWREISLRRQANEWLAHLQSRERFTPDVTCSFGAIRVAMDCSKKRIAFVNIESSPYDHDPIAGPLRFRFAATEDFSNVKDVQVSWVVSKPEGPYQHATLNFRFHQPSRIDSKAELSISVAHPSLKAELKKLGDCLGVPVETGYPRSSA